MGFVMWASCRNGLAAIFRIVAAALWMWVAAGGDARAAALTAEDGTMVVGLASDPPGINPAITAGAPEKLIGCMIYEGLVRIGPGFSILPALAASWEIAEDGRTYTFHLVTADWQDGQKFTARDVKFSLEQVNAKYGPLYQAAAHAIERIETPDPVTVVMHLRQPFGPLLTALSCETNGAILPAHVFEHADVPGHQATLSSPVGTGPFRLKEWVHGDHLTLERNPAYWRQKPHLESIVARVIPNPASRVLALQAGEIDFLYEYDFPQSAYARVAASRDFQLHEAGFYSDFIIILNTGRPPLDQVLARQALLLAIDRNFISRAVFSGLGTPATGPFDTRIAWANNPMVNYDRLYPYNPSEAVMRLDQTGLKPGLDGTRFSLDLVFDSSREEYGPFALALQRYWGAIGVKVNLVGAERAVVLKRVYGDYAFGATLQNYTTSGDPALGIARGYTTESIRKGANFNNASRYSNPEVDALFARGQALTTQDERAVPYRAVQEILARDLPILTINQMGQYNAASVRLHNLWGGEVYPFWPDVWIEP